MLLLQQLAQQPFTPVLGIHPLSREVQKLPGTHLAVTAVQVILL